MNTPNSRFFALLPSRCGAALLLAFAALAAAQVPPLSSPLGAKPAASAKPGPATFANGGVPGGPPAGAGAPGALGSGAGYHSPNSSFAPLPQRADVVPWSVLADIKIKTEKNKVMPVFNASQLALNQKSQRIQGFMMPLEPGEKQKHFLVTSVPMSCGFCLPGGPESMVEVRTKTPVKYTLEPIAVEGKFAVLPDDNYGLFYRMTDAVSVK
ncbi:MAG: DUF3299 domain-containing protein [Burkholderiaceae bacterium]